MADSVIIFTSKLVADADRGASMFGVHLFTDCM
jgi:hypothetical protein